MRHSHQVDARPCATGLRGRDDARSAQENPRFSRELTEFLLELARVRRLAGQDPAAAARQLADWIGSDD